MLGNPKRKKENKLKILFVIVSCCLIMFSCGAGGSNPNIRPIDAANTENKVLVKKWQNTDPELSTYKQSEEDGYSWKKKKLKYDQNYKKISKEVLLSTLWSLDLNPFDVLIFYKDDKYKFGNLYSGVECEGDFIVDQEKVRLDPPIKFSRKVNTQISELSFKFIVKTFVEGYFLSTNSSDITFTPQGEDLKPRPNGTKVEVDGKSYEIWVAEFSKVKNFDDIYKEVNGEKLNFDQALAKFKYNVRSDLKLIGIGKEFYRITVVFENDNPIPDGVGFPQITGWTSSENLN